MHCSGAAAAAAAAAAGTGANPAADAPDPRASCVLGGWPLLLLLSWRRKLGFTACKKRAAADAGAWAVGKPAAAAAAAALCKAINRQCVTAWQLGDYSATAGGWEARDAVLQR
jgi:hypothetical protein